MILIDRSETDPYFNIAAEEYVLKEMDEEVFMLWINEPSVIIGKHQVAAAEADIIYAHSNDIPVIRRISGGGTVYHDKGNLNYSLISHGKRGQLVNYEKYSATVIRALAKKSIAARLQGTSNLVIGNRKFSGNAEHIFRNRVLHHGTLLFNTDLDLLRKCIRPDHRDYVDRSIRSNDSSIVNLLEYFENAMTIAGFRQMLAEQIKEDFPEIKIYRFTDHDKKMIRKLADKKYKTREWNFSYSPKYELQKEFILDGDTINFNMKTTKGYITEIRFSNNMDILQEVADALIDTLHHPEEIQQRLLKTNFTRYSAPYWQNEFLKALF